VASSSSPPVRRTAAPSTSSRWPPLHPLQRGGRRWQRAVVGRWRRAPFPTASSSPPVARRPAVAAGSGGTVAAGNGPVPLVFCFLFF
jgi:hypothetical protein